MMTIANRGEESLEFLDRANIDPASLTPARVEEIELRLLQQPQREAPVIHHFVAGVYIREVHMPAGSFAIGHHHKHEHINIMLKGRVTALKEDGTLIEFKAPCKFIGKPGRKIGVIHEDTVWLNVFETSETDVAKLEELLFEKSDSWFANQMTLTGMEYLKRQPDREDFAAMLEECGYTAALARAEAECEHDRAEMPGGTVRVVVAPSPIEGKGLFATAEIKPGEVIAPANIRGMRTIAGRFTNHSATPNAEMVLTSEGIDLVAIAPIKGCLGGGVGDEITIDYRQAREVRAKAIEAIERKLCQA
jgi:hypothetical protein